MITRAALAFVTTVVIGMAALTGPAFSAPANAGGNFNPNAALDVSQVSAS